MVNSGFASLFNITEDDLQKKSKGKETKPAKKPNKKAVNKPTDSKVARFKLPVRIRCGYIRTDFTAEEFGGKTLDEKTIKIKLREQFPELSGLAFSLRDLLPTITAVKMENTNKAISNKKESKVPELEEPAGEQDSQETGITEAGTESVNPLDVLSVKAVSEEKSQETGYTEAESVQAGTVGAKPEGLISSVELPDFAEAEPDEAGDNTCERAEGDTETENAGEVGADENTQVFAGDGTNEEEGPAAAVTVSGTAEVAAEEERGGSWLTLQIYYKEIAENQKLSFPLKLVNGEYEIPVNEGMAINSICQLWVDSYPEYKGCKLYYDDRHSLLVPFMEIESGQELKEKEFELPITVGFLHLKRIYTSDAFGQEERDTVTLEEIRKLYGSTYPEYRFSTYCYNEEENTLFPVITRDEKISGGERMATPVSVRLLGLELILQESDFRGKSNVSLEEVRQVLEEMYPEYSKERTEMLVDAKGFVVPVLRGSRKGYIVIPNKDGRGLYFAKGRDGHEYRIENYLFGIFTCRCNGDLPQFYLTAPKIPGEILNQVVDFFKTTPTNEAAVQLFYLPETRSYEIFIPEQQCTTCNVNYKRSWERENQWVLMMDIHSHGRYSAYFSHTDDADEKGTRLYMVIGNLNTDRITWALRAGIAGFYQFLQVEDIFEGGMRD